MDALYRLLLAQKENVCSWVRKANVNPSAALAGWRNFNNSVTTGCVVPEAASETDVSVEVFVREHHGMNSCGRKGKEAGWAEEKLSIEVYLTASVTLLKISVIRMFLQIDVGL